METAGVVGKKGGVEVIIAPADVGVGIAGVTVPLGVLVGSGSSG